MNKLTCDHMTINNTENTLCVKCMFISSINQCYCAIDAIYVLIICLLYENNVGNVGDIFQCL